MEIQFFDNSKFGQLRGMCHQGVRPFDDTKNL